MPPVLTTQIGLAACANSPSLLSHLSTSPLPSEETEGRPPITIKFEIPYFTMSGVQVRYLKIIEKSGYQALPWVRYITQNGGEGRRGEVRGGEGR